MNQQLMNPSPQAFVRAYHGSDTADITRFVPSRRGSFGPGIYFTDRAVDAKVYGEYVYVVDVAINNPWVVDADPDSEGSVEEDFDSPCVEAVLALPRGRCMLERARSGYGLYGQELADTLLALGHDGIIATYPDGCQEIIAFAPEQITITRVLSPTIEASLSP